jgi:hypothetical protein
MVHNSKTQYSTVFTSYEKSHSVNAVVMPLCLRSKQLQQCKHKVLHITAILTVANQGSLIATVAVSVYQCNLYAVQLEFLHYTTTIYVCSSVAVLCRGRT